LEGKAVIAQKCDNEKWKERESWYIMRCVVESIFSGVTTDLENTF